MALRKSWWRELAENGLLHGIAAGMVGAFYGLARLTHLMGPPLLAGILIISSLHFIDHLA
ncbi:MAG: hypothetical protein FJY95_01680 [Candidatus Handelsmanbacteria bacterium]|nr:hypothetical protein [Candidatus Handelsmanbacteria bacterium]